MKKAVAEAPSEMEILRRIVDGGRPFFSAEAAQAIMHLDFSKADRERMNELAARNRDGRLSPHEDEELDNYIWVGQILGILQSKARQSLPTGGRPSGTKRPKS
jgi:hypothetical protein